MATKIEWMIGPREPGSMQGILPGESLDDFEERVGDAAPELTDEDFARAKPISDFAELLEVINNGRARIEREKALKSKPTK